MQRNRYFLAGLGALVVLAWIYFFPPALKDHSEWPRVNGNTMGTTWTLVLPRSTDTQRLKQAESLVLAELEKIDTEASTWKPYSALSQLNSTPVGEWRQMPDSIVTLLHQSKAIWQETGGAFNPTLGYVSQDYGFQEDTKLESLESLSGGQVFGTNKLGFDTKWPVEIKGSKVRLLRSVSVDLSAIAKGYAVDLASGALLESGFSDFLLEIGGETFATGRKDSGLSWIVGILNPAYLPNLQGANDTNKFLLSALVIPQDLEPNTGISVATSGDYFNRREIEGVEYSHIIDPNTQRPLLGADSNGAGAGGGGVASLSIALVGEKPRVAYADALATSLTVMAVNEGVSHVLEFASNKGVGVQIMTLPSEAVTLLRTEDKPEQYELHSNYLWSKLEYQK